MLAINATSKMHPPRDSMHVKGAVYPVLLALGAMWVLIASIMLVVPGYSKIYADFGTELPALTRILMNLSHWLYGTFTPNQWMPGVVCLVLGSIALITAASWIGWHFYSLPQEPFPGEWAKDEEIGQWIERRTCLAASMVAISWMEAWIITASFAFGLLMFVIALFLPFVKITTSLT